MPHTPEPWYYEHGTGDQYMIYSEPAGCAVAWTPDRMKLGGEGFYRSGDEDLANAQLLTAAPKMLEALKSVEWFDTPFEPGTYCPSCMAERGKAHSPDCLIALALAAADPS